MSERHCVTGPLLIVYGAPVIAAFVTVTLLAAESVGLIVPREYGVPTVYFGGVIAITLSAWGGLRVGRGAAERAAWCAAYAAFAAVVYCMAAIGFALAGLFIFMALG